MTKLYIKENFEGSKSEQVFEASKATFNELGMEILKVRAFAFLIQARTTPEEDLINANLLVSNFEDEFTLSLSSETADQESLKYLANRFVETLNKILCDQG